MNATHSTINGLPQLLTIQEACQLLALNKRTLYREIARGRFPRPIKIRRMSRFHASDVVNYLETLSRGLLPQKGSS